MKMARETGGSGGGVVSVAELAPGQSGRLVEVTGGGTLAHRLAGMGLTPGVELRVVRCIGPVIVEVRGGRLILGRGMVRRLFVRPTAVPEAPSRARRTKLGDS